MTRDEIMALQPGRELDELIATRVLGWHWDDDWRSLIPPEQKAKPSEMWTDWQQDEEGVCYKTPINENHVAGVVYAGDSSRIVMPEWSKDIKAAWRVVERITRIPQTREEAIFAANTKFAIWWNSNDLWAHTAAEAAFAICRAALCIMEEGRNE